MFTRILGAATVAGLMLAGAAGAFAHGDNNATAGAIEVGHAWARASAGMARAGGTFLELTNSGSEPDALLKAAADVSDVVELHTHIMEGDVMKMRPVERIDIAAGESVQLKPGGLHVMLIGLKEPLKEGTSFPLTLTFEKAGETTVTVKVNGPGAMTYDGTPAPAADAAAGHGGAQMQHGKAH
ncbi:copper chaperone PCu(A)C [Caenispirillum bisanense]|uniref:copper chaperone PCu(A)C n=1 Tax=Caenispirillum bisanense TaxID=414052 RepID=UPI0031CE4A39